MPEDAEQPLISRATLYDPIADIRITGPFSERALKGYAKKLRDGLLNAGIDSVVLTGARDEEIWIKVREEELRRLGLTLDERLIMELHWRQAAAGLRAFSGASRALPVGHEQLFKLLFV